MNKFLSSEKTGVLLTFCLVAVMVALIGTSGCQKTKRHVEVGDGGVVPKAPPGQAPDYKNRKIAPDKHLPTEATNVKLFNNYWTYFELEVGGKTRKFLMHHSHPKDDWQGRESLVELKD